MSSSAENRPLLGDEDFDDNPNPSKRPRDWVARQACDACRAKKTRCNQERPCGVCSSAGIECIYGARRATKHESSFGAVLDAISALERRMIRLEAKIDGLPTTFVTPTHAAPDCSFDMNRLLAESPYSLDAARSTRSLIPSETQSMRGAAADSGYTNPSLSFSAHQTVSWDSIRSMMPLDLVKQLQCFEHDYHSRLELERQPLEPAALGLAEPRDADWLSSLTLSFIQELVNSYFNTFNRIYPLLDRDFYFQNTFTTVIRDGFGCDLESCLTLIIMALGCRGLRAADEIGHDSITRLTRNTPALEQIMNETICGLSFFDEASKRFNTSIRHPNIQLCQYYMAAALFFTQIVRPVDAWLMINFAASVLVTALRFPASADEWSADIRSRLFWSAILMESVTVQELELARSQLKDWEDVVPLPKFIAYPQKTHSRTKSDAKDVFYHYHFLAQIAHRILLSRIGEELYRSNPSTSVAHELRHQLEQWAINQPNEIKTAVGTASMELYEGPAHLLAISLLKTRYRVGIFHIGRPFLYKALHHPTIVTKADLEICEDALKYAMDWALALDPCTKMSSLVPLRFFVASHMFGQLLIFYAIQNSPDARIRNLLPTGYEKWCNRMLFYLSNATGLSPTIERDFELVSALYHYHPPSISTST